ncbi:hypothetical protein MNBD_ACTINO02-263, partial [hydrothermal vent metagenome]
MAKSRIYELARELGRESKEVLERAQELGLPVKTASSGLDEEQIAALTAALAENPAQPEPAPQPAPA